MPTSYQSNRIQQLQKDIEKAQKELEFHNACLVLEKIQETAYVNYAYYLVAHYGCDKRKVFEGNELVSLLSADKVWRVKLAISSSKSASGVNTAPAWASKALKAAKIVDNYLKNDSSY